VRRGGYGSIGAVGVEISLKICGCRIVVVMIFAVNLSLEGMGANVLLIRARARGMLCSTVAAIVPDVVEGPTVLMSQRGF
jgi:hypothetical protein